jgi:hypothetical protein
MVIVHRKKMFVTEIAGVRFLPGMNQLSDAEFEKVKKHKNGHNICTFDEECNCGNMMVGGQVESETTDAVDKEDAFEKGAKKAEEIQSMSAADAKKVIAEMVDGVLLREIKKLDSRRGVQTAIDKRMKEIDNQVGSDLAPVSKEAPLGNGEDVFDNIGDGKQAKDGGAQLSAIPAMQ